MAKQKGLCTCANCKRTLLITKEKIANEGKNVDAVLCMTCLANGQG